jgi:hypothetical protein
MSGSYVPNTELQAMGNFESDEGKGNQLWITVCASMKYQLTHVDFSYPGFIFNM